MITDTASEASFTEHLVEVMHGRRLRQLMEQDQLRVIESHGKSAAEISGALQQEIADGICEWRDRSAFLPKYNAGPRELRMAAHDVEWCARKVVHLQGLLNGMDSLA
jgi:hypothetical protein